MVNLSADMSKPTNIVLPKTLKKRATAEARKQDMSFSAWIRSLIRNELRRGKK